MTDSRQPSRGASARVPPRRSDSDHRQPGHPRRGETGGAAARGHGRVTHPVTLTGQVPRRAPQLARSRSECSEPADRKGWGFRWRTPAPPGTSDQDIAALSGRFTPWLRSVRQKREELMKHPRLGRRERRGDSIRRASGRWTSSTGARLAASGLPWRDDRGSASLWVIAWIGLVWTVALTLMTAGTVRANRHRAQLAADQSALTAATVLTAHGLDPCTRARHTARVSGAALRSCALDPENGIAAVTTVITLSDRTRLPTIHITAKARAGPPQKSHDPHP